jgi:cell division cycle 20-like protein 1, cofactor of APC complex
MWDTETRKLIRTFNGHVGRVGALSWSNGNMLSSGSKDKSILNRDIRMKEQFLSRFEHHKQEICGLKWSFDDQYLASGGNDNKLMIWQNNCQPTQPTFKFSSHQAAVKAIAWSPHQSGLLASGGGTADRCIKFWNAKAGVELQSIDTGSQVCNLMWSKSSNEIVSTHGYSDNAICVWKYPSCKKIASLTGHSLRVLYLAMSPDAETVVTGAGDETLRFWKLFPKLKSHKTESCLDLKKTCSIR